MTKTPFDLENNLKNHYKRALAAARVPPGLDVLVEPVIFALIEASSQIVFELKRDLDTSRKEIKKLELRIKNNKDKGNKNQEGK